MSVGTWGAPPKQTITFPSRFYFIISLPSSSFQLGSRTALNVAPNLAARLRRLALAFGGLLAGVVAPGVAATAASAAIAAIPTIARAQHLLVPMDDDQSNQLKAYGLTFNALRDGNKAEWFINYRGGSYLLPDLPELRKRATLDGVSFEPVDNARLTAIRAEIAGGNMEIGRAHV